MDVIDLDTGKTVRLDSADAAYSDDIAKHVQRFTCVHPQTELRRALQADGRPVHRLQCLHCGELTGPAIKQDKSAPALPDDDGALRKRFQADKLADRARVVQEHVRRQRQQGSDWWRRYNAYLETPHWQAKRALVLKRAGGTCEGCGTRPATQVHHQTYRDAFDAFLFQLVAVCKECHDRYHAKNVETQDKTESDVTVSNAESVEATEDDGCYESPCCACRWQSTEGFEDWCGQFHIPAAAALSEDGDCGPKKRALEPLK